jgi:hypothetical protein
MKQLLNSRIHRGLRGRNSHLGSARGSCSGTRNSVLFIRIITRWEDEVEGEGTMRGEGGSRRVDGWRLRDCSFDSAVVAQLDSSCPTTAILTRTRSRSASK